MMILGFKPSEPVKERLENYINVEPERFTVKEIKYNFESFNNMINMKFGTYKLLKQKVTGLFGEELKEFKKLAKKHYFK